MNTTTFLAQLWGPTLIAVSIGIFTSRAYYAKIYRDIEKEPMAILIMALVGIPAAITHILAHNIWGSFGEGLISLLGWMLLVKTAVFAVAPGWVEKSSVWYYKAKLLPGASVVMLVVGVYLSWLGFFV